MEQEADQLNTILQHFNLNEVILFGHSDGGTIALLTASKYPSRIVATICEAGHIFVEELTLEGIRSALHAYETTNLAERLAKYHGDKVDHLFKAWTTTWMRDDFRSWNIEEFLPSIIAPLLFIQGENDEYGTLQQVSLTVEGVSGSSEACIIPKIGHTPHKEALEKCLLAASNFIKKQG